MGFTIESNAAYVAQYAQDRYTEAGIEWERLGRVWVLTPECRQALVARYREINAKLAVLWKAYRDASELRKPGFPDLIVPEERQAWRKYTAVRGTVEGLRSVLERDAIARLHHELRQEDDS